MKSKTMKRGIIVSAVFLLLAIVTLVPSVRSSLAQIAYAANDRIIHYFNNDVNADDIQTNNYNFGPNRYERAENAVKDGKAESILAWTATNEATGDFFDSIEVDPALCAAVALHMDESLELPVKILEDEQDVLIGQRADAAHKHFLADQEYWDRAIKLIKEFLGNSEITIEQINSYTSAMYMWHNGLDGNKPSVIVRNTRNAGGHMVVFNLGKPGIVKFRMECGYQPVDIPYWPTPDTPPIPDNPEPTPTPDPDPTPTPDPDPDPTPTPDPDPTPTPTPEPKDPDAGPQAQIPDDEPGKDDFGGGENHDNDEGLTDEPESPTEYVPPAPPQKEEETKPSPTPAPTAPTTSDGKPDGSSGTQSGSKTVDEDNGKTEQREKTNPDTGKTTVEDYEVVAGDGENHSDLNKTQEEKHNEDTVEEPLKDDGVNEGDLDPSMIE